MGALQTQIARLEERIDNLSKQLLSQDGSRDKIVAEIKQFVRDEAARTDRELARVDKKTNQILTAIVFVVITLASQPAARILELAMR